MVRRHARELLHMHTLHACIQVRRHALELLHRCGTKLRAPSLHAAFTYWISAHEIERAEAAYEASLRQNTSLEVTNL